MSQKIDFSKWPILPYTEIIKLKEDVKSDYLIWCKQEWDKAYAELELERAGGVAGVARTKAEQQTLWFDRRTYSSFIPCYTSHIRTRRYFCVDEMFESKKDSY
ncbi:hypothetical protein NCAS_0B05270 [Naumovozyma castellii]|uniref:Uncharacterized protein n=1 Tax=Naumovozyma castellii TaxID=27288 RepID=G0V9J5_NAUCA|nr:hypothetical protein NCAS_0B05270 [Naumovozyma castellii CBS 4309]CCC68611.1 hypothetical protein NCAS_0B05270 [Naumovozyma castellii CBS 4309]